MNADLKEVSDSDFKRTAMFMLAGIFLILIVMLALPHYACLFSGVARTDVFRIHRRDGIHLYTLLRVPGRKLGCAVLRLCHFDGSRRGLFHLF